MNGHTNANNMKQPWEMAMGCPRERMVPNVLLLSEQEMDIKNQSKRARASETYIEQEWDSEQ